MSQNSRQLRRVALRLALLLAAAVAVPACGGSSSSAPPPIPSLYVATLSLPDGTVATAYSQTLAAAYGTSPYTWSLHSGSLPAGLALNPATGVISGTPTGNGSSAFVVRATDAVFTVANRGLSITVSGGGASAPAIPTTSLPDATQNYDYLANVSATGGLPPYAWSVSAGTLPAGLSLDGGTGFIGGTPTATGTSNFTLQVADSTLPTAQTATRALSITVNAPVTVSISSLPPGTQGAGYTQTLTTSNGTGPFVWTVIGGAPPPGVTLNPNTGALSGTATTPGTFSFTVQVVDANGASATGPLSLLMNVPVVVTTMTQPDWTQGHPYSQTFAATGGTLPYTNWTVTAGALPNSLTLNPTTGVISGTPTVANTFNFTVQVTDTAGAIDTQALSILINPVLSVTTLTLPPWTVNRAYSQALAASGGTPPYTLWEISAGTLPAGLSLNAATGALTGTPTAAGTTNFTVRVTDSVGATDTQALSLLVNPNPTVTTTTLPAWTINRPYNQTLAVADGTAPFSWSVLSGSLPAGLNLAAATGVIDGTPTAAGAPSFTVQVTDSTGAVDTQLLSITINPAPSVSTVSLPDWTQGHPFSQTLAATGGTTPYTNWTISAGTQPTGLSLNAASGVLDGMPTAVNSFTFTVQVTDTAGATATRQFTVVIAPSLSINNPSLPDWTINRVYSQTLSKTGGTGTVSWSVLSGTPPTGLALNPGTGVLGGTPTATNTFSFTIRVTDSVGATGDKAFTVIINPVPTVSTASLPDWTQGHPFSQVLAASAGTPPYTDWTITLGTQPTGLSLNATSGVLDGTPTAVNSFTFTVQVTDTAGATATRQFTIAIAASLAVTTASLPDWTQGHPYSPQTLAKSGGTGTVAWSVSVPALPTGLSLAPSTGVLDGTPTAANSFTFTILVTDSVGATGSKQFTIVINPAPTITTASLPDWTQGHPYTPVTLAKSGGTGTVAWSVSVPALPTGLSLAPSTGVLDGTPTAVNSFTFTVQVTDTAGASATKQFTIAIAASLGVTTASLPDWTQGHPYSPQTLAKSGGTGTVAWSVSVPALPTGLNLNPSTGVLDGTPSAANSFTFTLLVTDSVGATASKPFTVAIAASLSVTTASLPDWTVNIAYTPATLAKSGGTGTVTWSVSVPALPTSLNLNPSTGVVNGTPSVANSFTFTILVTDSVGATASKQFTVVINPAPSITTVSLPDWTVNVAYTPVTLAKSGGTGTVAWTVSAATLPDGMSLNSSTGLVDGTPTNVTTFNFTIQITDSVGGFGTKDFQIIISAGVVVTTASLPDGTQGQPYSETLAAVGGTGTLTWTVEAPSTLPTGLFLSVGGTIGGTPSGGAGPTNFTVRATDSVGGTDTQVLSIVVILSLPEITTPALPAGTVGVYYSAQVTAAYGTPGYTWSNTSPLPAWMTLDTATGVLSGTPPSSASSTIDLQVTDSLAQADTKSFSHFVRNTSAPQGNLAVATWRLPDALSGSAYSGTIYAVGGSGPYTFTFDPTGTPLPASLSMSSGGVITGTPLPVDQGQYTLTVRVTDGTVPVANQASANVLLMIGSPAGGLFISTNSLPGATVGASYAPLQVVATGGVPPYTWDLDEDTAPTIGMFFTRTGLLYGIPLGPGSGPLKVRVRDSANPRGKATKLLTITVAPPAPSEFQITTLSLPPAQLGVAYAPQTIATNGASGPVTSWIGDPGNLLSAGLTFNWATATVSGTPTSTGNMSFFMAASNSATPRKTAGAAISFLVGPATPTDFHITTLSLPDILPYETYSQFLQTANASGAVTWTHVSGVLPGGITLNPATGELGGFTSGYMGGETYIFAANDGTSTTQAIVLLSSLPGHPEILGSFGFGGGPEEPVLPMATVANPYAQVVEIWNADRDDTSLALLPGRALPASLSLDSARRAISGTPTVPGRYRLECRIRENMLNEGMRDEPFRETESMALLEVLQTSGFRIAKRILHAGREGVAHGAETLYLEGSTGSAPYSFTVTSGALPPGLALDPANGTLTGTPSRAGSYRFTVQAAQGASTCSMAYELPIDPALAFGIVTERLPNALKGVSYSAALEVLGATGPVAWSDAGSPTSFSSLGLVLDGATGVLSGPPLMSVADGLYEVTVTVDDGLSLSVRAISILVESVPIALSKFSNLAFVTHPYGDALLASGGSGNYTYALAAGEILPLGISMDSAGNLTGTPSVAGLVYGVHVRITDTTQGRTGSGRLMVLVKSDDLPALGWEVGFDEVWGQVGTAMTRDFFAQGGVTDYSFSVSPAPPSATDDLIPPGLSLGAVGPSPNNARFTGIPTTAGDYSYTIRVTDALAATADYRIEFKIQSDSSTLAINTRRVPDGSASVAYPATQLRAYNPAPNPVTWSAPGLPAGLSLDGPTGVLSSGSPLAAGTYYFIVTVTDTVTSVTANGRVRLVVAP